MGADGRLQMHSSPLIEFRWVYHRINTRVKREEESASEVIIVIGVVAEFTRD